MIVYRDRRRPRPTRYRTPAHLARAADLTRREASAGDLLAICDPMFLEVPDDATWREIDDEWEVCLCGDLTQARLNALIRQQPVAMPTATVVDAQGRKWAAPAILLQSGALALPVPWGSGPTGQWQRVPTTAQAAWIAAAEAARAEVLATHDDGTGGLANVPLEVAAGWASTLLCATYHLSPSVIKVLALLDERLVAAVLLAAAGMAPTGNA